MQRSESLSKPAIFLDKLALFIFKICPRLIIAFFLIYLFYQIDFIDQKIYATLFIILTIAKKHLLETHNINSVYAIDVVQLNFWELDDLKL